MSLSFSANATKAKSLKTTESISSRFPFLDRTRGLIMVLMALDHALFFWSSGRINNEGFPLLAFGQNHTAKKTIIRNRVGPTIAGSTLFLNLFFLFGI